jgi:putative ABC transport system substrate-binding protein
LFFSFDGFIVDLIKIKEKIMKKYGKKVVVLAIAMMMALSVIGLAGCGAKTPTVGISQFVTHPALDACRKGAIDELEAKGYVDGDNIKIDYKNSEADTSVATTIAQQFVSEKVDVILAIATPSAQAAYAAAQDKTPLVFSAITDPAAAGIANDDGSNLKGVTGVSDFLPIDGMLQLIKTLTPDAVTIGILHNTAEVNSDVQLAKTNELAPNYGFEIKDIGITSTNEVGTALDTLLPQVDVVMNLTDNLVVEALAIEIQKCSDAKVPLYGSEDSQVKLGGLASAGIDYYELGKATGDMIADILGGKAAEDISIVFEDKTTITINTDVAAALGITIPDELSSSAMVTTTTES